MRTQKEMLQLSISLKEKKKEMDELLQSVVKVKTMEAAMSKQYEFWSTQPVPKFSKNLSSNISRNNSNHDVTL